jgi:hypothetical protein
MALIRKRGALLMGTQFVSDLKGIRGNAKTQFAFYTNEGADLDEISKISEPYHWIIQRLKPYEFVDLAQLDSHVAIYVYRLNNPKPDFKSVVEWKPQTAKKENSERQGSKEIDIPSEIVRLLSQPANQQDLAKRFTKEYGNTVDYWKMTLKTPLKIMHQQGEISATETDYIKWRDKEYPISNSLIYHRKGDYSYHDWLVGITADILYHKGLTPAIQAHGLPLADILVESPKRLAFEIESGSKNGYKIEETQQRISDFKKQGYKVYVIVPNQEVKGKYKDFRNIFTALELWRENL